MRADTLTGTFTALRELPRAVLHSVAPAVPRPVRHALRSGQRAMQLSQRVAWYSRLSALVLLAPPSRAQSADAENTKAELRERVQQTFDELGVTPAYPTYREGLAAVLKAGG